MERFGFFADQNAAVSFLRQPENGRFRHGLLSIQSPSGPPLTEFSPSRRLWVGVFGGDGVGVLLMERPPG
jgi:hypothetical protein